MDVERYTLRLGSEIYIPAEDWRPERRTLIQPLRWREIDYQGNDPVSWAVAMLQATKDCRYEESLDGGKYLESVRASEWPGEDLRVDYARLEGSWTREQADEVLAAFPPY